jgi:hypothetical protein
MMPNNKCDDAMSTDRNVIHTDALAQKNDAGTPSERILIANSRVALLLTKEVVSRGDKPAPANLRAQAFNHSPFRLLRHK